jgi:O-antigen/teichoic acid export membrane protein
MPRYAPGPSQHRRELLTWSLTLTTAGIGLALSGYWLIEPLINLLFGPKYSQIVPILQILGWAGAGIFACAGPVTWLTITNRQYYILLALIIADIVGLALGLFLAGYMQLGLSGIAQARTLSSWFLFALYLAFSLIQKLKRSQ